MVQALCLLPDGRLASGSETTRSGCGMWRRGPRPPASKGIRSAVQRPLPAAGRAARLGLLGQHDPAVGRGDGRRDRPPRRAYRAGSGPLRAAGRAARLGLSTTTRSGCGMWRRGRDRPPRRAHEQRSQPFACCRTGGSPRAPGTTRSGCGMWRRAPRPPASKGIRLWFRPFACCRTGGSPRALGTTRSGCGMWRRAPRPPASKGIRDAVQALCVLPDGRLASGSADNTIRLWDVATGAETARLEGHYEFGSGPLPAAGRAARLGLVGQHDPAVGRGERAPRPPASKGTTSWVQALCLLPDGRLASGSSDKTIRLWDVATGAETARLEGHTELGSALCLLPDGRLASGSSDKTIRLWDVATGAETRPPRRAYRVRFSALCLLPDGRLASGSWDNTIRLWDVATGAETARLEGHTSGVQALCLLPDGRLASGSSDNTIRLWDVERRRRDRAPRNRRSCHGARHHRAQSPRRRRQRGPPALAGNLGLRPALAACRFAPLPAARISLHESEVHAMIVGDEELDRMGAPRHFGRRRRGFGREASGQRARDKRREKFFPRKSRVTH